jgi:lysosomal acid lipase/cholesteryl ester hydrolase
MNLGKRRTRSRSRSASVVASTAVVDNVENFTTSKESVMTGSSSVSSHSSRKESTLRKRGWNGKPVVLLNHGFLMSSEIWLCNLKESQNLPFLLAEQGCDVWFANARGNKYSQQHMSKNPKDQSFWEFSLNEMAMYDLPDVVDVSIGSRFSCESITLVNLDYQYILEMTGAPSLTYIGFSQGTAQAFAGLSINPKLNDKVNLFIALAPATTPSGMMFYKWGILEFAAKRTTYSLSP